MRSFFGMVVSYFVTEMIISNSVISKLMPKNSTDAYVDIFLHGILQSTDSFLIILYQFQFTLHPRIILINRQAVKEPA